MRKLREVKLTDLPDLDVDVEPYDEPYHQKMLTKERTEHAKRIAKRITKSSQPLPPKTEHLLIALPY